MTMPSDEGNAPLVGSTPLVDLRLGDLSQLVDLRRLARHHALGNLRYLPDKRARGDSICYRDCLDADDANPGVVLASVVRAVSEVTQPRLELRAVVLLHHGTVCDDACLARDGRPVAGAVEEGDVDVGIALQLVGLV